MNFTKTALAMGSAIGARKLIEAAESLELEDILDFIGLERGGGSGSCPVARAELGHEIARSPLGWHRRRKTPAERHHQPIRTQPPRSPRGFLSAPTTGSGRARNASFPSLPVAPERPMTSHQAHGTVDILALHDRARD